MTRFLSTRALRFAFIAFSVVLFTSSAFPAELNGIIRDHVGATQPEATVILRGRNINLTLTFKTVANGHYAFTGVPAGDYELTVRCTCFKIAKKRVLLEKGASVTVDFELAMRNPHCSGID